MCNLVLVKPGEITEVDFLLNRTLRLLLVDANACTPTYYVHTWCSSGTSFFDQHATMHLLLMMKAMQVVNMTSCLQLAGSVTHTQHASVVTTCIAQCDTGPNVTTLIQVVAYCLSVTPWPTKSTSQDQHHKRPQSTNSKNQHASKIHSFVAWLQVTCRKPPSWCCKRRN